MSGCSEIDQGKGAKRKKHQRAGKQNDKMKRKRKNLLVPSTFFTFAQERAITVDFTVPSSLNTTSTLPLDIRNGLRVFRIPD